MRRLALSLLLIAAAALADVSGKWSGSFIDVNSSGDQGGDHGALITLTQKGNEITGTAGPDEQKQWAISKGKIEGDKITFEVQTDGPLLKFELNVAGDHLKGEATGEHEGEVRHARVDLTRQKE